MIDYGYGLELVELCEDDMEDLRKWRNDPRIWRWCRQNNLISDMDQAGWYKRINTDPTIRMFGIAVADMLVGVCGLTSIDLINRRAEFSLYINPQSHENGYGTDALLTLFAYGFNEMNLHTIWGETFDGNPAGNLFKKIGMTHNGRIPDFYWKGGKWLGANYYSINSETFFKANSQ